MKRHIAPSLRGMTLVEVLCVISMIAIALAFVTPSFKDLRQSQRLAAGSESIRATLRLARQLAVTGNVPIIASFCKTRDDIGTEAYNVLLLSRERPDGTLESAAKPLRLPPGFSISETASWSTLMNLPEARVPFQSASVACRQLRFRPNGVVDLPPSGQWYWTLFESRTASAPGKNFITMAIDPVTGGIIAYQP